MATTGTSCGKLRLDRFKAQQRPKKSIDEAESALGHFPGLYQCALQARFTAKIGIENGDINDWNMVENLLAMMADGEADFTKVFRHLPESLELYWDRDDKLCADLSGRYAMLHIPAELEKGHQDRLLPIAPEFAEFLEATPKKERTGRVFRPMAKCAGARLPLAHRVGELVSAIGKAAGVKVHTDPRTGRVKYASAHDLRRSFGERWAARVMPQTLMELMRHESIETTLKFYVGRNAVKTAETLYAAVSGNTSGNTTPKSLSTQKQAPPESSAPSGFTK